VSRAVPYRVLRVGLLAAALLAWFPALAPAYDDTLVQAAETLRSYELQYAVDASLTLDLALRTPVSNADRYVRVIAVLRGVQGGSGETARLYVEFGGRSAWFPVSSAPSLETGETVRLLVRVPAATASDATPMVIAWAPEALLAAVPQALADADGVTQAPVSPTGAWDPLQPGSVIAQNAAPQGGGAATRTFQQPRTAQGASEASAYAVGGGNASYYAPSTDEWAQFRSYANLARHLNPRLSEQEAGLIAQCLFAYCSRFGVPRPVMASVIYAESRFNPRAKSPVGALGLCQLMPGTAAGMGLGSPYDISQSIYGGTLYLSRQMQRFYRSAGPRYLEHALAAYNAGPGAVEKYHGVPPYAETQRYVRTVGRMCSELSRLGYR